MLLSLILSQSESVLEFYKYYICCRSVTPEGSFYAMPLDGDGT